MAALTVLRYEKLAHRFLRERAAVDASGLVEDLTAADVIAFLLQVRSTECSRRPPDRTTRGPSQL